MLVEHEALHLVGTCIGCDTNGGIIHNAAYGVVASVFFFLVHVAYDLAKGQHANELAVLHNHERTNTLLAHDSNCIAKQRTRRGGIEKICLKSSDCAHFQ